MQLLKRAPIGWAMVLGAVALLATSCEGVESTASASGSVSTTTTTVTKVTYDASSRPYLAIRYLTRDGSDRYTLKTGPGVVRINAPTTNRGAPGGSNTRAVVWPPYTKAAVEQQTCSRWTDAKGTWVQQGLVLRLRIDGSRLRSVVVAKNVVYGANWQFNVMTWDTGRRDVLQIHGAAILRTPFERNNVPRPLPWNVCARTERDIIRVKGWRKDEPEPSWHDKSHTGAVRLPAGWTVAGKAGWYGGHIAPGATIGMSLLRTTATYAQTVS